MAKKKPITKEITNKFQSLNDKITTLGLVISTGFTDAIVLFRILKLVIICFLKFVFWNLLS